MWPTVNKDLLPMKGHYFLFNAGTAPVQPFMPVLAKQLGFSSVVVGTIYSILPLTGMISKPLFGGLADRYKAHKLLFLVFQVVTIIAFFCIQFIPEVPQLSESKVGLVCGAETNFHICSNKTTEICLSDKLSMYKIDTTVTCAFKCDFNEAQSARILQKWNITSENCIKGSSEKCFLEFDGTVPLQHTILEKDCLYFRVSEAIFESGTTVIPYCDTTHANCEVICKDPLLNKLFTKTKVDESVDVTSLYQFWILFLLLIGSWIGMAVVVAVSDAICFEILGERANLYGNQRLWGSIGWGIFAVISGLIVDEVSQGQAKKNYTPLFYLMLVLLISDVICSYSLRYNQTKMSANILKDVGRLLLNVRVDIFLLWCIFIGMCTGIQWNFLYWYLEDLAAEQGCDAQNWIKTLEGLVSGVQCFIGELPSFFLSGWVLQKLGHVHSMTLVLFVIGVRFLLYSILVDPWWTLPIEVLQATYGLFYSIMVSYASIVAPPGTEATIQGLVGSAFEGIGVAIGSFLGGIFFQNYGGATCFRIFGIACMILFVVHAVVQYFLNRTPSSFRMEGKESTDEEGVTTDSSMETVY